MNKKYNHLQIIILNCIAILCVHRLSSMESNSFHLNDLFLNGQKIIARDVPDSKLITLINHSCDVKGLIASKLAINNQTTDVFYLYDNADLDLLSYDKNHEPSITTIKAPHTSSPTILEKKIRYKMSFLERVFKGDCNSFRFIDFHPYNTQCVSFLDCRILGKLNEIYFSTTSSIGLDIHIEEVVEKLENIIGTFNNSGTEFALKKSRALTLYQIKQNYKNPTAIPLPDNISDICYLPNDQTILLPAGEKLLQVDCITKTIISSIPFSFRVEKIACVDDETLAMSCSHHFSLHNLKTGVTRTIMDLAFPCKRIRIAAQGALIALHLVSPKPSPRNFWEETKQFLDEVRSDYFIIKKKPRPEMLYIIAQHTKHSNPLLRLQQLGHWCDVDIVQ